MALSFSACLPSSAAPPDLRRSAAAKLSAWITVRQESWEGDLSVQGNIPQWLKGTYLRNGPGLWNVGEHEFRHLFDGYATLVGVHFENGKVRAGHRQIESEAYRAAMEKKKPCYREFSETPNAESLLAYAREIAGLLFFSKSSLTDNANTGVVKLGDGRVVCLTETIKGSIQINPKTLKTVGKFKYEDNLGWLIQSAHPIVTDEEYITVLPDLVRSGYQVVRMEAGSNERKLVGRVECRGKAPGWVHSFAVTESFVVVPEMPLRYCARNLLRAQHSPLYKFQWQPDSGAFLHIVSRATGEMESSLSLSLSLSLSITRRDNWFCQVTSVEVPLYVTFHFINAYEEKDEGGRTVEIVVDCCEHNADTSILEKLTLKNLRSFSGVDSLPEARVGRLRVPLDGSSKGTLEAALDPDHHGRGMDMATINPKYLGKKYRYVYACGAKRPCNFPNTLTKVDLVDKKAVIWHEEGSVPSEPLFVERPGAVREDDGAVISLVSDKNGEGYVLLLDASTFEEISRGWLPYGLPYGLHGCWIPRE